MILDNKEFNIYDVEIHDCRSNRIHMKTFYAI